MSEKKKRFRQCPYCQNKISYFDAIKNLRKGEYTCKKCRKYANIKFDKSVYLLLIIMVFISCIFAFLVYPKTLKGVILSIVPFVLLYFFIPMFFKLTPVKLVKMSFEKSNEHSKSYDEVKTYKPKSSKYTSKYSDVKNNINNNSFGEDGSTRYIPNIKR